MAKNSKKGHIMKALRDKIYEHSKKVSKLQSLYIGNNDISFKKGKELQKMREKELDKMNFFINLQKEINKGH